MQYARKLFSNEIITLALLAEVKTLPGVMFSVGEHIQPGGI